MSLDLFMQCGAEAIGGVLYYKRQPVGRFEEDGFVMSDEGQAVAANLVAPTPPKVTKAAKAAAEAAAAALVTDDAAGIDDLLGKI